MAIQVGTALGSYSITAKIGEGGMGEVYRARDTKLDRDVALKVLPQAFTDDPDRLARFGREAKVLASLNHPNIAHIYGLEEAAGTRALVLELIEGPTLADRIVQGPIPVDEALPIAKQIAEALEAAHEAGVIHRDLKPANIKLKPDGTVKVLDFGLAKALQLDGSDASMSMSPTISLTAAATQMGMVIGTAAYMAPEQAKGKVVDKRADVWAFGAVLYEMLTGKKPFAGDDVSTTLARVIEREPDWEALPSNLSPVLATYLRRCLAKEPKQRIPDIADMRLAMEGAFETTTVSTAQAVTPQPAGWRQALPWVAAVLLAVITGVAVWTLMRPGPQALTRFQLLPPPGVQLYGSVQIAPDGQTVAFVGLSEGQPQVYTRALDQLEAVPVRGTEGMLHIVGFSPDGQWILGLDSVYRTLTRVPLGGGPADTVVASSSAVVLSAWGPDDTIVQGSFEGLWSVPAYGGERTQLTTVVDGQGQGARAFLPGGRAVLFTVFGGPVDTSQIAVYDFETGQPRMLLPGTTPAFSATGHLVFWRDGSLWAVPFDLDRLDVRGVPVRVLDRVSTVEGIANYALADNGTLVYLPGDASTSSTLGWVNREGVISTSLVDALSEPRLSYDGTQIVFRGRGEDLWIWDLETGREQRLTEGGGGAYPAWTPDDTTVTFMGDRGEGSQLYERAVDLSSETQLVLSTEFNSVPGSWTPDGQTLVYYAVNAQGDRDIWTLPVGDDPVPFLVTEFNEKAPRLSPNGKWLAYVSDQTGEDRVYVQAFPDGGRRIPVSTGPGTEAVWSRDGLELFYRNGNQMWAVKVETEPEFVAGRSELLFEAPYYSDNFDNPSYDVSLDGEQFLMVQPGGIGEETAGFTIVENWFEELKERVPID